MKRSTKLAIFEAAALAVASSLFAQEKATKWDITKIDVSQLPPAATQQGVTFGKDIQPLFQASCVGCHGKEKPRGGLRLDSLEGTLKGGRDGKMIVAGDSSKSLLVAAAARIDDKIAMPPKHKGKGPGGPPGGSPDGAPPSNAPPPGATPDAGPPGPTPPPGPGAGAPHRPAKPLTTEQVALLRAWVDQGAN